MNKKTLKTISFDVPIPNLDGDAIAKTIRIDVQAYTDPETGEDVLTPESLDLIEKTQARHMGLLSPDEIRALRHRLMLRQDEISELLQIGAKTYTRWESGRARPSRSLNILLCALRDGVFTTEYLRGLQRGGVTDVFAQRLLDPEQWNKAHTWVYYTSSDSPKCWSDHEILLQSVPHHGKSAVLRLLEKRLKHTTHLPHPRHSAMIPDRLPTSQGRWQWQQNAEEVEKLA